MPKIWREALIAVSVFLLQVQRLPETTLQTRKVEEYYQETIVWREVIKEAKMTLKSGLKDFQCRLWLRRRKQETYSLLLLLSSQNVRGLLFERRHEGT
jgi:hypothetical protein